MELCNLREQLCLEGSGPLRLFGVLFRLGFIPLEPFLFLWALPSGDYTGEAIMSCSKVER